MLNRIPKAWILLAVFVMLFMVPTVSATDAVTYVCCKNFTTDYGTLIESFDNVAQWTVDGNATIYQDTTNVTEGTGAVGISVNNTDKINPICGSLHPCGQIEKTVSFSLAGMKNVHLWAYTPDASNISYINFYFFTGGAHANFYNFGNTLDVTVQQGWNHFVISREQFVKTGTINWDTSTITAIRIVVYTKQNTNVNIAIDQYSKNIVSRPKIMFHFDDARQSVYTLAKSVMDANNQRGDVFDITSQINDAEGTGFYMNLAQVTALYNDGWDIGSHTKSHSNLVTLSNDQLYAQLNDSHNTLFSSGFNRSDRFIAYPYGTYNQTVINATKNTFVIGRTTVTNITQANMAGERDYLNYTFGAYGIFNRTYPNTVKNIINFSVNRSALTIFLFHNITNTEAEATHDIDYTLSNFTDISNYLASRSADIDVVTFYDYVRIIAPNYTPILGKTVNITATTGLSEVVVNSYINDQTVNMAVVPSSDSVNVTVSSWATGGDYYKAWSEESNTPGITTSNVVGDLPANTPIKIKKNGVVVASGTTNSTGYITLTSSPDGSPTFEVYLSSQEEVALQNGWCGSGNSTMNGAFLIGTVLAFVVGAVLLFTGINKTDIKFAVAGVLVIIGTIVTLVLGNVITSRMLVCG